MDTKNLKFSDIYWRSSEKWAKDKQDYSEALIIRIEIIGTNDWYHIYSLTEVFQSPENYPPRRVHHNLIAEDKKNNFGRVKVLSRSNELTREFRSFAEFFQELIR